MRATLADYQAWLQTLTGLDHALALSAGLDAPPSDSAITGALELRESDGLTMFFKNGVAYPLEHESTPTREEPPGEAIGDLAQALRRVFEFIIRGIGPNEVFKRERTLAARIFVICRALRMNGFDRPSLAEVAKLGQLTRSAVSKIAVELRDHVNSKNFQFDGREGSRRIMSKATSAAWARKKKIAE